jgi:LmbE family N-acetylglucosaminyl deacetylase
MSTLVCFHAHPDDEAIATGGVIAKAAEEGHRVVLVTATKGEHGEVPDGFLSPDEELWQRRMDELHTAANILGVARVEILGYVDSGMMGMPTNESPSSFWKADVIEAASRLADILSEENAEALTVYDDHGNYGHPDHIQVHRVGLRAAAIAGTPRVFEATINRDHIRALLEAAVASDSDSEAEQAREVLESGAAEFGSPQSMINTTVNVRPWVEQKRRALFAHASQVTKDSFFATMPDEAFLAAFGQEWFIRRDPPAGWRGTDLLTPAG